MVFLRQRLVQSTTVVAMAAVGLFSASSTQAAIVSGSITGTWSANFGQGVNVNAGDPFTANYRYDNTALTPFDNSSPGSYQDSGVSAPLLSLVVNSGTYRHTFDFSNGSSQVLFESFLGEPGSSFNYRYNAFQLYGTDNTAPGLNAFNTGSLSGSFFNGNPINDVYAELYTADNQGRFVNGVSTDSNVKFTSGPTSIPTPALLPGLIGMGVAVFRKRRAKLANLANDA